MEMEVMRHHERKRELELQNSKMEVKLKEEQDKVKQLRLEYDRLQQDDIQQRELAQEDYAAAQRRFDDLRAHRDDYMHGTIRAITDIERACAHLRGSRARFVWDTDRAIRKDEGLPDSTGARRESGQDVISERPLKAPLIPATAISQAPELLASERKRGPNDANSSDNPPDNLPKKIKSEVDTARAMIGQSTPQNPSISAANVSHDHPGHMVERTLDPRLMAQWRSRKSGEMF
jgi:hypothetical protein